MALQLTLVTLLWAVGVSALVVLAQIWRRGQLARRPALSLMALGAALYAFGYAVELMGTTVAWVFATFHVQHLAIAASPTLLLWLAADYGTGGWRRARWWRWLSVGVSVATVVLVYTNPLHDLFHANPRMVTTGPFPLLAFDRGPAYWAFQAYAAAAVLTANAVFVRAWFRRSARPGQAATLLFASLVPWIGNLVNQSGVVPYAFDVMPFTLVVTSFFLYRGVVRQGLSDLAPIARDLVFDRMGDAAVVLDPEGRVIDQNQAAVRLLGRLADAAGPTPGELLRDRYPELAEAATATDADANAAAAADAEVVGSLRDTIRDEPPEVEFGERTYSVRWVELRGARRRPRGRVLVLRDITRYVQMEALLRSLATTDEVTAVPNRRHFLDLAARGLAHARRHRRAVALIVFDIDRFKDVNDTHGHQVGDAVLRRVAAASVSALRSSDVVGRFGGEEFAVFLPETEAAQATRVAERLRVAIAATVVDTRGRSVRVTASVGVASATGDGLPDLDTLIGWADHAQYAAKARGGDAVVTAAPVHLGEA